MFLLHQRFIGNLLKKYRENANKSYLFDIQQRLKGINKIDTTYHVGNIPRNLINVKKQNIKIVFVFFTTFPHLGHIFDGK